MNPNQLGPIESVRHFMESIWQQAPKPNTSRQILRGQAGDWDLLPKLFRDREREPHALKELGERLLADFKARSPYLLPSTPTDEMDWLSLAQHHGLPTRLLDWTANPLIALFFAVEKPHAKTPTVWIYDATEHQLKAGLYLKEGSQSPELTTLLQPGRHSQRVTAQAGWHTVHGLDGNQQIVPMNKMEFHSERLTKVLVNRNQAKAIRAELKDMGIDHATVYGDLTSICRAIQDDLEIPPSMRLHSEQLLKRQEFYEAHILAHLLVNGLRLKVGEQFSYMSEPNEDGWRTGGTFPVDSGLLQKAQELATQYAISYGKTQGSPSP